MDNFVNEQDFELLKQDDCTFQVLDRILKGPCDVIRSDHEKLILCHSEEPYPVWIWTPDGLTEAEKESAWQLAESCRPMAEGYRYNIKEELAEYFLARAGEAGMQAGYLMRMYAYDCPEPVAPEKTADGEMYKCTPEDLEEAADLYAQFYPDIGETDVTREHCLERARSGINDNEFFFWKNGDGKTVACCGYKQNGDTATVGPVFTVSEYRRKHYAQNLVYRVTKRLLEKGFRVMLYTDAGYEASNECYRKIGYVLRGRLCELAAVKEETGGEEH